MSLPSKQMITKNIRNTVTEEIRDHKKLPGLLLQNAEGIQNLLKIQILLMLSTLRFFSN